MKKLKFLIASDKFKDSLTAQEAANAIEKGLKKAIPYAKTTCFPLADGGEGTLDIISNHLNGQLIYYEVADPLFRTVKAPVFFSGDTAYIEMAKASGINLLNVQERNCYYTTTLGTGQLMVHALEKGVKNIIIGIGGSATCDGGIGIAQALGYAFYDKENVKLEPTGKNLNKITSIDISNVSPLLRNAKVTVASDVINPLSGPNGAAHVYGPQKGANEKQLFILDKGLIHLNQLLTTKLGKDLSKTHGAGAAGGVGAGLIWFADANIESGAELIMKLIDFDKLISEYDYILTGEGKLDRQSFSGKLLSRLLKRSIALHIPIIAFCGAVEIKKEAWENAGFSQVLAINNPSFSLEKNQQQCKTNLEKDVYILFSNLQA